MTFLSKVINAISGANTKAPDTGAYTENCADTSQVNVQDTGLIPGEDFVAEQFERSYNLDLNLDLDWDNN